MTSILDVHNDRGAYHNSVLAPGCLLIEKDLGGLWMSSDSRHMIVDLNSLLII